MVKYKYDTLDNLPGDVLTDIRALADHFLIALPNINNHFWHHCWGERWFAKITLSLATSLYLYFYFFLFFILFIFFILTLWKTKILNRFINLQNLRKLTFYHGSHHSLSEHPSIGYVRG